MLRSFVVAMSTYSKIPMPHITWDEKSMKYSMCYFPLVGVVIGFFQLVVFSICSWLGVSDMLRAALLCALPILITGGIHMDGFLDTVDARSSYRSREERLEILKDPHTGAFAIIYGIVYFVIDFALCAEIDTFGICFFAMGYVSSRILSGMSVVAFKKAKEDGMLAQTAKASDKKVFTIMLIELVLFAGVMVAFVITNFVGASVVALCVYAAAFMVMSVIAFIYYRLMSYKIFGGTTGDLAGYFLQVYELMILFAIVGAKYVVILLG